MILKPFVFPFIFSYKNRYEIPQECVFWNHGRYKMKEFNENYHFCLDVWWFVQIYSDAAVLHSSRKLGSFRIHPDSKSSKLQDLAKSEIRKIVLDVKQYTRTLSDDDRKSIIKHYYFKSLQVVLARFFMPWVEFFFEYHHPPYLTHAQKM